MSSFIRTSDHLTVVFEDGETATVYTTNPNYDEVVAAVREKDWEEVRRLAIPSTQMKERFTSAGLGDRVDIIGGVVYLDNRPMHNTLTDRIIQMNNEGYDVTPMARFLENLMENPSHQSVNELYDFLEKSDLPITEDGYFIAYKRVRDDYMDIASGTFDNSVGEVCEMPRNQVDDNRDNTCSAGLHFCSRSYLPHYGAYDGCRTVIVKINPADVVSIPSDYNNAKGRTCRYEVIGELEHGAEEELEGAFHSTTTDEPEVLETTKRAVEQFDLQTQIVLAVFPSVSMAASQTDVDGSSIGKVCRGERRSAGGFGWRFVEEIPFEDDDIDDIDVDFDPFFEDDDFDLPDFGFRD